MTPRDITKATSHLRMGTNRQPFVALPPGTRAMRDAGPAVLNSDETPFVYEPPPGYRPLGDAAEAKTKIELK